MCSNAPVEDSDPENDEEEDELTPILTDSELIKLTKANLVELVKAGQAAGTRGSANLPPKKKNRTDSVPDPQDEGKNLTVTNAELTVAHRGASEGLYVQVEDADGRQVQMPKQKGKAFVMSKDPDLMWRRLSGDLPGGPFSRGVLNLSKILAATENARSHAMFVVHEDGGSCGLKTGLFHQSAVAARCPLLQSEAGLKKFFEGDTSIFDLLPAHIQKKPTVAVLVLALECFWIPAAVFTGEETLAEIPDLVRHWATRQMTFGLDETALVAYVRLLNTTVVRVLQSEQTVAHRRTSNEMMARVAYPFIQPGVAAEWALSQFGKVVEVQAAVNVGRVSAALTIGSLTPAFDLRAEAQLKALSVEFFGHEKPKDKAPRGGSGGKPVVGAAGGSKGGNTSQKPEGGSQPKGPVDAAPCWFWVVGKIKGFPDAKCCGHKKCNRAHRMPKDAEEAAAFVEYVAKRRSDDKLSEQDAKKAEEAVAELLPEK